MWNPLSLPYDLFNDGKIDDAVAMLNDFVATISAPQFENTVDKFWPDITEADVADCVREFYRRNRRFGGLENKNAKKTK